MRVDVTSMTNREVIIKEHWTPEDGLNELRGKDTIETLKCAYQNKQGVPPNQQNFYFPVADGVKGCQPATDFKWWADTEAHLGPMLRDAMLAQKLLKGDDAATLGEIFAFQNDGAKPGPFDAVLRCFIVLQVRLKQQQQQQQRACAL